MARNNYNDTCNPILDMCEPALKGLASRRGFMQATTAMFLMLTGLPSKGTELSPSDLPPEEPSSGVALCLSGGGFRAMLFHTGALMRLNELGLLLRIDRISSVSGGSITAGLLGLIWQQLDFEPGTNVSKNFRKVFVDPIRRFAGESIDILSIMEGILLPGSVADRLSDAYQKYLYGDKTLQDLPDKPQFVINATNVQSKALWRFTKSYMRDYRVGEVRNPRIKLAVAVAASSAFPPFLSPVEIKLKESDFTPGTGKDLQRKPFTTDVVLTDGGVYDNLGLEPAWKNYDTIWVSDAGGIYSAEENPARDWIGHTHRVFDLVDNQVRDLRKRELINSYEHNERKGAYWGIWTVMDEYKLGTNVLPCPAQKTQAIASISTRLTKIDAVTQERIINWGYAVCDAAMRKFGRVDRNLKPDNFPYPDAGVG